MFTVLFLSTLIVAISGDVKVVSTVTGEDRGLDPCVRQCYGSTGATTTWSGDSSSTTTDFDTTECGFLAGTSPMVSATLSGNGMVGLTSGASLYRQSTTRYLVWVRFLYSQKDSNVLDHAKNDKWRVDWTAVGYTCN